MARWWVHMSASPPLLDEYATVPAVRGVMLTFDDFVEGMDKFGERIQPLMASRRHVLQRA